MTARRFPDGPSTIAALHGLRRELAIASTKMNFSEPDAAPEDLLNRVIWHSVKGYNTPYPTLKSKSGKSE